MVSAANKDIVAAVMALAANPDIQFIVKQIISAIKIKQTLKKNPAPI